jgi:aspartyl aminopeptidase
MTPPSKLQRHGYITALLDYIGKATTSFHAVENACRMLSADGFIQLDENRDWSGLAAGKYFVIRNGSSLIGFTWSGAGTQNRLQMVGAHTDSPCLKLKPNPLQDNVNCLQLGTEVYGGALLAPWFDRELSLAGRVCWIEDDELRTALVDFKYPLAIIPSLAIHLDREANKKKEINKQTDLVPIIGLSDEEGKGFFKILGQQVEAEHAGVKNPDITDFDLFFYDAVPPMQTGIHGEFITGPRLDNLVSCFAALRSLGDADEGTNNFILLNDHEEIGSVSSSGAQGSFLRDVLERLLPDAELRRRVIDRSLLVSADNAHAVHPNFTARHDPQHQPMMNRGPVIKFNANQRYATNAETAGRFRLLCKKAHVPTQEFVMKNDITCGSTTGPLTSAEIGIPAVDVGIPSLAMHSIRETAACSDCWSLYKVLRCFFTGSRD